MLLEVGGPVLDIAEKAGIDGAALARYVDEQIYTLPGTNRHREEFTVLLTGSRAVGTHAPDSDVDIDVLCPRSVYERVQAEARRAGLIQSETSFFCPLCAIDRDWQRYFGESVDGPHFSLQPLESVRRAFDDYEDVALWVWTNAAVLSDPGGRFQRIRDTFRGYPADVLVRKIKYRWLLCWYWGIDVYPHHHRSDDELAVAASAILNAIMEMLRVFFLVENRPFPYTEKLPEFARRTELGSKFAPLLQRWTELVVGKADQQLSPWERLDKAIDQILDDENDEETRRLEEACTKAIINAGVESSWMENYFSNIDELLLGKLGPAP